MDKSKQPGIRTNAIMLIESKFVRFPQAIKSIETVCSFDYKYSCLPDNIGQGELTLISSGKCSESNLVVFEAEIKYIGVFQMDSDEPNMQIEEFMKVNASAHIFPYLREFLSSLSVRAGLPTIILPPMNIVALTEGNKKDEFKDSVH
ncbi:MAG: protein-export chaperone SecB [Candidatus Neomarinimicrobiota bacterium]|nr:protein-export chaperone SecB [Candidatus Cloacimonadota bacterium]